jgi:hypothetical protein
VAGEGTVIENLRGGEFLVSAVEGFLSVDPGSKRISIGPKIISREGVSARTTGNLQLTGEYEEFGDVQEQRSVDGGNITIHGDVFGNINSRGGDIVLSRNLMGGSATNADGGIRVQGVASGAVLQTKKGEVALARAESCIISGTRVVIGEASNCEIMAEEVIIKVAEGCAIAARRIEIVHAGPRKNNEMLLYALVPDTSKFDKKIAELQPKVAQAQREAQQRKEEMDEITGQTEVRNYLTLATRVRKREVTLDAGAGALVPQDGGGGRAVAARGGQDIAGDEGGTGAAGTGAGRGRQGAAAEDGGDARVALLRAAVDRRRAAADHEFCAGRPAIARSAGQGSQGQGALGGGRHDQAVRRPCRADRLAPRNRLSDRAG